MPHKRNSCFLETGEVQQVICFSVTSSSSTLLSNKPYFPEISPLSNRISCKSQEVSCSAKFSFFIFFNVILLNQSTHNLLFFNFLTNFILLTLAYVKVYTNLSNFFTVYIIQHQFFLMSFFESFVISNVLKIAWVANVNNLDI